MEELIIKLKSLPRDEVKLIVFGLMREGRITFHELAEMEAEYLKLLERNANERTHRIVSGIIKLHCGKKNREANLKALMHTLVDYRMVNLTHKMIDDGER